MGPGQGRTVTSRGRNAEVRPLPLACSLQKCLMGTGQGCQAELGGELGCWNLKVARVCLRELGGTHSAERARDLQEFAGAFAEHWARPVLEGTTWPGKEPHGQIQGGVSQRQTRSGRKPVLPSQCHMNVPVKRRDHPRLHVAARPPG